MSDLIVRMKETKLVGSQQAIATYLTKDIHRTAFLSGAEIAKECNVSLSAVTRLAQKLGYAGFPELKKDLEALYRNRISPSDIFESFVNSTASSSVADLTFSQEFENLSKLQSQVDQKAVDQIVKSIVRSENVYLVGIGVAEVLVDQLAALLEVLGKPVIKLKSFGITKKAELISFSSKDVVIGISFQRILREVRDVLVMAKSSGAKTIAITDSESNSLALACERTAVTPVIGTAFGMSLVAPMVMINIIGNSLAARDTTKNQKLLQKVKRDWETYPIFCD